MNDDARLFEFALCGLDNTSRSTDELADSSVPEGHVLRSDLSLVQAMRHVQVPEDEMRDAKARVASRLREEMSLVAAPLVADDSASTERPAPIAITRQRPARLRRIARAALAAAAILLLSCVVGWQVTSAARAALPGSPFYSIKRGEETLALDFAGSDQRRGEVLVTIADHRLSELREEASKRHDSLVQSLATQFDTTMHQLIALTATMTGRHENTTVVMAGLSRELSAEYTTLRSAQQTGDMVVVQALTVTSQSEMTAISNSHINLPPSAKSTPVPTGAALNKTPSGRPPSTPGSSAHPTRTPPVTPGSGNSSGNSNGSGTGNGNESGDLSESGSNPNHSNGGYGDGVSNPLRPVAHESAEPVAKDR